MAIIKANPSQDWIKLGELDPYFGVLSDDKYKTSNMNTQSKDFFYESGQNHISKIKVIVDEHFPSMRYGMALDFGCGVGRITLALAQKFSNVVGVDVSQAMLREARTESTDRGIKNVDYVCSENAFKLEKNKFDFVHTYIVLQHIPPVYGYRYIEQMIDALRTDGVGAIHFTYGVGKNPLKTKMKNIIKNVILFRLIGNIIAGRKWNYPAMQMNHYDIVRILEILRKRGINKYVMSHVVDWENLGLFIFFQKSDQNMKSPWDNPAPGV